MRVGQVASDGTRQLIALRMEARGLRMEARGLQLCGIPHATTPVGPLWFIALPPDTSVSLSLTAGSARAA